MKKRPQQSAVSANRAAAQILVPQIRNTVSLSTLKRYVDTWIMDCEIQSQSPNTNDTRRGMAERLYWYIEHINATSIGTPEMRGFFAYLTTGHKQPGGRWGKGYTDPVRPTTARSYHAHFCVLFKHIVAEGGMDVNPMQNVPRPRVLKDQIQPFTPEQADSLIRAAKGTTSPLRDTAIVLMLLDTGLRSSELCGLKIKNIDLGSRCCSFIGKGNKRRAVSFGATTAGAIHKYLRSLGDMPSGEAPLFASSRGQNGGDALTRSGLQQMIERLGIAAGVEQVRCSPHTFRHTFAISFLRSGGTTFALKELLGHTDLDMTQNYVKLAEIDIQQQARSHSPVDHMRKKR